MEKGRGAGHGGSGGGSRPASQGSRRPHTRFIVDRDQRLQLAEASKRDTPRGLKPDASGLIGNLPHAAVIEPPWKKQHTASSTDAPLSGKVNGGPLGNDNANCVRLK